MSGEQVVPETKGVSVNLLSTVDLGPEIEGLAGRQLRMRMVTIEPGGVFGPVHDHKADPVRSTCCKERSLTIGTA
jgi:quercetin dioxygenase-like cupin family protein